ncbi:MAG: hypothetical protein ACKPFK_27565, partial [Dolichospermum sp.]
GELQTLPNIDINIKTGNSLISRFPLNWDLRPILKKSDWNIEMYQDAVRKYHHPDDKKQKQEMENFIKKIKDNCKSDLSSNNPIKTKLRQKEGELENLDVQ